MSGRVTVQDTRWPAELVAERWEAFTHDDREALLRFGSKPAPWESTPDVARRILLTDPKVSLYGIGVIDAIFRSAYEELAA